MYSVCITDSKARKAGADMAADLQYVEKTARQILKHAQSSKIIIEKSTLPVKTALAMEKILSDPEFEKELVARGRKRVEEFNDSDRMAKDYLRVFAEVLR